MKKMKKVSVLCLIMLAVFILTGTAQSSVKIVWKGKVNADFITKADEPTKAIIALISSYAGTDCWWENDKPNEDYTNLSCQLTTALGLGLQCSDMHKKLMKKWFAGNKEILEIIDNCYLIPYTATSQKILDRLKLTIDGNRVTAEFKILLVNVREGTSERVSGKDIFEVNEQSIKVIALTK
jgi:hypothetical protein